MIGIELVETDLKVTRLVEYSPAVLFAIEHLQVISGPPPEVAVERTIEAISAPPPERSVEGMTAGTGLLAWLTI
ncbi:MAG: hypothetical protein AAGA20_12610 [Planctomycetota bacterium]